MHSDVFELMTVKPAPAIQMDGGGYLCLSHMA